MPTLTIALPVVACQPERVIDGEQLKAARGRVRPRLTQKGLADMISVDEKTVRNWENGVYPIPATATALLMDVLDFRQESAPTPPPISQASDAELIAEIEGRLAELRAALARARRVAAEHARETPLRPGEGTEHEQIIGWLRDPSTDPVVIEEMGHLKNERLTRSLRAKAERAIVASRADTLREQLDTLAPPGDRGTGTR